MFIGLSSKKFLLIVNIQKKQETTWPIETEIIMNVYLAFFFLVLIGNTTWLPLLKMSSDWQIFKKSSQKPQGRFD